MNNNNQTNKYYNSKDIFDISLFKGQEFKISPLPKHLGIQFCRNKCENDEDVLRIQREWLSNCGYFNTHQEVEKALSLQHIVITSILYPRLSKNGFILSVLLYEHGFMIDDLYFEKDIFGSMIDKYLDEFDEDQDQIGKTFWDIINDFKEFGHKGNLARIVLKSAKWTRDSTYAMNKGRYNAEMEFEEYCSIRGGEIGSDYASSFIMACEDFYVPNHILLNNEPIRKMIDHYRFVGFLSNDLGSFKKEIHDPKFSNSIKLMAVKFGDIQKGIDYVYQLLIYHFEEFNKQIDLACKEFPNEPMSHFLESFRVLAWGTYNLHSLAGRYTSHNNINNKV